MCVLKFETHLFALRSMGGFSLSKGARCPHYVASVTAKGPLGSGPLNLGHFGGGASPSNTSAISIMIDH